MSLLSDFAAAVRALAAGLRGAADDPADQVRQLVALAGFTGGAGPGADLCRRAALTELARACTGYQARSYEEGTALRDQVCGLLQDEEVRAADAGEDRTFAAFRSLRIAVALDLTARCANLARMQSVELPGSVPALVLAHRLYGSASRADELAGYAQAAHPSFMPDRFRAPDR